MAVDHPVLHGVCIDEGDVSLNASAFVLKGEFSVRELRLMVLGEPSDDGLEGIKVVIVDSEFLLCHLEGNYYYK